MQDRAVPALATARPQRYLFAREGASVLCVDNVAERAQETVDMITKEGFTASPFVCDVSRGAECEHMAEAAMERYGKLQILQNNVGIGSRQGLGEITEEEWDNHFVVNVRSTAMAAPSSTSRLSRLSEPTRPAPRPTRPPRWARQLPWRANWASTASALTRSPQGRSIHRWLPRIWTRSAAGAAQQRA